jgi:hypothetical protein
MNSAQYGGSYGGGGGVNGEYGGHSTGAEGAYNTGGYNEGDLNESGAGGEPSAMGGARPEQSYFPHPEKSRSDVENLTSYSNGLQTGGQTQANARPGPNDGLLPPVTNPPANPSTHSTVAEAAGAKQNVPQGQSGPADDPNDMEGIESTPTRPRDTDRFGNTIYHRTGGDRAQVLGNVMADHMYSNKAADANLP